MNPRSKAKRSPRTNSAFSIRHPAMSPAAWARIRLFAMDVDGVLTDGTVRISSDGTESKSFSILDGYGIRLLANAGLPVALISGRASEATTARATELAIAHVIQGRIDKLAALQELAIQLGLSAAECAYMGDDVIDVPALEWAGIGIAPPNAMPATLAAAQYVTTRHAGHGAVREVCEHLLAARAAANKTGRQPAQSAGSKASKARSQPK
jgi:3-deoxy-D-manno-octulosonate 8-phosphate phosphatase (KDO 8-P phosphatase)